LEIVIAQQTDFEFEVIVGEDCSTDGTRELLLRIQREHGDRFRLFLPDGNLGFGGKAIYCRVLEMARGDYVATLDGDDYWTSPAKLQRQVDLLDAHPEYALCFHDAKVELQDGSFRHHDYTERRPLRTGVSDLIRENFIAFSSALCRRSVLPELGEWYCRLRYGDWPLFLLAALQGDICYIPEALGVWRAHGLGAYSGLTWADQIREKIESLQQFVEILPAEFRRQLRASESGARLEFAQVLAEQGDRPAAYRSLIASLRTAPLDHVRAPRAALSTAVAIARGSSNEQTWVKGRLEVIDVVTYPLPEDQLLGGRVDLPSAGTHTDAIAIEVAGWALGRASPAVAVEVSDGERVLARTRIGFKRPDLARAFPGSPHALRAGFETTVRALGIRAELELIVHVVLRDGTRIPLGIVRARRYWRRTEDSSISCR
jgi:hypothetical protein